ncbi:hypothetical protein [Acinetobacter pittii]|uniref:hypothetical protein n=1 Tax=Acinetobacter pittii TaxID=48296 RepID=UPI0030095C57
MRANFFTLLFLFVAVFGYMQWFFAEQDNEILRQELVFMKYSTGSDHDDGSK